MTVKDGQLLERVRTSAGVHWASLTTSRNVPIDVGVGVVYERDDLVLPRSGLEAKELSTTPDRGSLGGYLELSSRLRARGHARSWISGRGEVMVDGDGEVTSLALIGRLSRELYAGVKGVTGGGGGNAGVLLAGAGTFAVGAYLESGVRHHLSSGGEFLLTAGLSVRVPAFVFFAAAGN